MKWLLSEPLGEVTLTGTLHGVGQDNAEMDTTIVVGLEKSTVVEEPLKVTVFCEGVELKPVP